MVGGGHLALFCGGRRLVVLGLLLGFVLGVALLGFEWEWLWFSEFGNGLFWDFIKAGFQPAFDYEDGLPVTGAEPFWMKVVKAVGVTLKYAVAGVSLALVIGSVMAVGASEAWWPRRRGARVTAVLQSFRFLVRGLATLMRSVHEFLWMLVFLAAFGTSGWAAVWALALPFGGILGKVFSEVLDEQSRMAAEVVEVTGGGGLMGFFLGVLPKALPDLLSYTLYRFECAVRSSAVLGFLGVPTLGYVIATAFEDYHLREVWTYLYVMYLYVMMVMVMVTEWWGSRVRRCLAEAPGQKSGRAGASRGGSLGDLWKGRPKWRFLRGSIFVAIMMVMMAWWGGESLESGLSVERRAVNFERFLERAQPWPVQQGEGWGAVPGWVGERLVGKGWEGMWRTFLMASCGAILAAVAAGVMVFFAVRTLAESRPLGDKADVKGGRKWRSFMARGVRWFFVLLRSIPEYVLAFLLMGLFGVSAWPLILALAIHNAGILGRLWGEAAENAERAAGLSMLTTGASRSVTFFGAIVPQVFNRFLLFFFYRWESCLREATIMGVLGVVSLGYLIDEAKTRFFYDDLLLYVVMGAGLVLFADLVSVFVRKRLRD